MASEANHHQQQQQTGCNFFVTSSVLYSRFVNEDDEEEAQKENFNSTENNRSTSPKIPPRPSAEKLRKLRIPNTCNIFRRRQSQS